MAQAQEIQRQVHRAQPRRVGRHAVPHVAAEVLDDLLGAARGLNGKSTHTKSSVIGWNSAGGTAGPPRDTPYCTQYTGYL